MVKFSLVLATIGREIEVEAFLDSLSRQTYKNFELIVVDQNHDDRVSKLISAYDDRIPVTRIQCQPGLSTARNEGIKLIKGDLVAFPDDDCWYPPELLEKMARLFEDPRIEIVSGQSRDAQNRHSQRKWPEKSQLANKVSIWKLAISYTVFMRKACVDAVGEFDEELGVGARTAWQSGEETDFLIRALECGYKIRYFPEVKVFHPQKTEVYNPATIERAKSYGAGMGRVLKKHHYSVWFVAYMLLRPAGGVVFSLITLHLSKVQFHLGVLRGRLKGWVAT